MALWSETGMTESEEPISMVQECVSQYYARKSPDGSVTITIRAPKRFANLWLVRLSNMRTTLREIQEFESTGEAE